MKTPRITIGMATYNDFEGVWATLQSIFLHNDWDSPEDVQIVIVDTSPIGSEHRKLVLDLVNKGGHFLKGSRTTNFKYLDMSNNPGTTLPRDKVFDVADAPYVCVMDCHVMLRSNTLLKLLHWFEETKFDGLVHGPILYDNLHTISTHFDDQFRGGMWGTWGSLWEAPDGTPFVCHGEEVSDENKERKSNGKVTYYSPLPLEEMLTVNGQQVTPTGHKLPDLAWSGHDRELLKLGYKELGRNFSDPPFEIPGQGMGLFASRKDTWLGFEKNCTGFGGEEMNIHTKYRQADKKILCLPFLHWNHRFGRSGGAPYPIPLAAKIRNYVLWAKELGNPVHKDTTTLLDRIYKHFVTTGNFPQERWDKLVADPVNFHVELKPQLPVAGTGMGRLDALFMYIANNSADMKGYAELVRNTAASMRSIIAFVKRADWEPVLASGFPKTLSVYQEQEVALIDQTHEAVKDQYVKDSRQIFTYSTFREKNSDVIDPLVVEPAVCDLLVIDKINSAPYIDKVLERHGNSSKFIILRGTQTFGEKAEIVDEPGLFYSIKNWIAKYPEWYILSHFGHNYGLTLLCRDPNKRPEKEVTPWPKGYGPGTELKAILASVGINPSPSCDCNAKMRVMDEWGVEECKAKKDVIVGWLEEKAEQWGWTILPSKAAGDGPHLSIKDKLAIGWRSLTTGIAFHVSWTDPYPGLVDEAIHRAEVKQK